MAYVSSKTQKWHLYNMKVEEKIAILKKSDFGFLKTLVEDKTVIVEIGESQPRHTKEK